MKPEDQMYKLQELQIRGDWYTLSIHPDYYSALYELATRGSYRRRTVMHRIVKA